MDIVSVKDVVVGARLSYKSDQFSVCFEKQHPTYALEFKQFYKQNI